MVGFLVACAASQSGMPESAPPPQVIEQPGAAPLRVERQTLASGATVDIPVQKAWEVMIAVYNDLGIEPTTLLHDTKVIGNASLKLRRSIGGTPLSRYLDCGAGTGVGPNADYWNVEMSVMTRLIPDGETHTKVQSIVEATARPVSLGSNPVVCSSTAALETRIAKLVGQKTRGY
jgi:hypothetical protein